jgi:hypothetical protein
MPLKTDHNRRINVNQLYQMYRGTQHILLNKNMNPRKPKPKPITGAIALNAACDRLLTCVEESYELSEEDAMWFVTGILYMQPEVIEANLLEKAVLFAAIESIKNAFKTAHNRQINVNQLNQMYRGTQHE